LDPLNMVFTEGSAKTIASSRNYIAGRLRDEKRDIHLLPLDHG
jgi:hypothetical protein